MEGVLQRNFGANLKAVRAARGISQAVLSEQLGFHRTYVGSLERGERNSALRTVERLADALGVASLDLLRPPAEPAPDRQPPAASRDRPRSHRSRTSARP